MIKYIFTDYTKNQIVLVHSQGQTPLPFHSIFHYLDTSCRKQGSSLNARTDYFKEKMQLYKFVPVLISQEEIYFPITNKKEYDCLWVNFTAIKELQLIKKECTIVFFDDTSIFSKNGKRIYRTVHSIQRYLRTNYAYSMPSKF